MKLNKIIVCLMICVMMFALVGCAVAISETPVDTEYIAPYDAMETVYEYQWDWWHGEYRLLPNLKMVHHEEVYRVQYKIVYSNGDEQFKWRNVDKQTYEEAMQEIEANE